MKRRFYVIAGPTASGKSGLAAMLAGRLGGRVINADSMQIYRDLNILTARPEPRVLAMAPHRLYGELDGADLCSAARWAGLARDEIDTAFMAGEVPVLCGGSGLYFSTLLRGIAEIPTIPAEIRARTRELHRQLGGDAFRTMLAALDPQSAARLPAEDSQRLMRAYEVAYGTGRTIGMWQQQSTAYLPPGLDPVVVLLLPARGVLYSAIDSRFAAMVEQGALDEVDNLMRRQLDPALPIMKALGVQPLAAHLGGQIPLDEAVAQGCQASRHYAKRQSTWFRHQLSPSIMFDEQFSESNWGNFCQKIINET